MYIPQDQGGPVIPPGTEFPFRRLLRLAGLRWRNCNPSPYLKGQVLVYISFRNRMVQSKVKSMSSQKSKSRYDRRPVNQYVLVPSPLGIKGVPSEKFQFDIRKCTLRRHFFLPLGGLHEKHAVQRGILVPTQPSTSTGFIKPKHHKRSMRVNIFTISNSTHVGPNLHTHAMFHGYYS
jgi:hypothetical protein